MTRWGRDRRDTHETLTLSRRMLVRGGSAGLMAPFIARGAGRSRTAHADDATPVAGGEESPESGAARSAVESALTELDTVIRGALEDTGIPGLAVAVVHRDEVVFTQGYGERETGSGDEVDADTVFQLASVSKPLASTVVAGLVGDGVVEWDSKIADLDPAFALHDPWVTSEVTIQDMLSHQSGLPEHAGDLVEDIGYSRDEVLHRLRYQPLASSFRSAYAYTNFGFTEGAVAAAMAAGEQWEAVATKRLYEPLGMDRTSSRFEDYANAENRALTHARIDGAWTPAVRQPDPQSPAGGASSTARDMAQWMRLHLNNGTVDGRQIIAPEALAETHQPHAISSPAADPLMDRAGFYGLGWNVGYNDDGKVTLSHSGAFLLGAATAVSLLPADELGIVVLTNAAPIGVPEAVALSFIDLVTTGSIQRDWFNLLAPAFAELLEPAYGMLADDAEPPAQPAPALSADAYTGVYVNDYFGDIQIVAEGNDLLLQLGPEPLDLPLTHYDRDIFAYQPVGENAGPLSGVTFTIGPSGQATNVVVESLDIHGQGTFVRKEEER